MKIALICPYDYHSLGGVQSHIRQLASSLRSQGHEVSIIAPRGAQACPSDVILAGSCRRIRFSGTAFEITWMGLREFFDLKRRLDQERFDVLHFHTIWNPLMPLQVLSASKAPKVATFHDTAPDSLLGKLLARTLMPFASAILCGLLLDASIAVSPSPLPHLTMLYKGKIHVVPNGVQAADFTPGSNEPLPQYKDGFTNLLYLGRLEERKGVLYLLEAFALLKKRWPKLRLLIAGDGHLRGQVEDFVNRRELPDVELLGVVDEVTKRRLYATCDLYCSPAVAGESFGIVLLEALASGKPAIGAANSGYPWVLQGEGAQLLVPPRDAEGLAAKIEQLLTDPALRERLARWGLEQARGYDWQRVAGQVMEVYREAMALKRQSVI